MKIIWDGCLVQQHPEIGSRNRKRAKDLMTAEGEGTEGPHCDRREKSWLLSHSPPHSKGPGCS